MGRISQFAGQYQTVTNLITVGVSPTLLCEPNPNRLSLLFSYAVPSGNLTIGPYSQISLTDGVNLGHTNTLELTFAKHPSMVQAGWYGISNGGQVVTVIEELQNPG